MASYSSIRLLLEAERERYILEAAELERRLNFVHNQWEQCDFVRSGKKQAIAKLFSQYKNILATCQLVLILKNKMFDEERL